MVVAMAAESADDADIVVGIPAAASTGLSGLDANSLPRARKLINATPRPIPTSILSFGLTYSSLRKIGSDAINSGLNDLI
jgi:hypothetical protein